MKEFLNYLYTVMFNLIAPVVTSEITTKLEDIIS